MRLRKATFSFTCGLILTIILFLVLDIHLQPPPVNSQIHVYYNYLVDNVSLQRENNDPKEKDINFINILNDSLGYYKTITSRGSFQVTTQIYEFSNVTGSRPAVPPLTTEVPSESRAHIIAIVSYMRSGSTLTADILQHFPGAMYVFEPFHSLVLRIRRGLPLIYLNGTMIKLKPENITDDLLREELRKWFECRFEDLDAHSLSDSFHVTHSRSMRKYYKCLMPKPHTMQTLRECLPEATELCRNAKYRMYKFIRLPMRVLNSVFGLFPNLQVVHLARDPRGSLTSQINLNISTWDKINSTSRRFCTRILKDLYYTKYLNSVNPQRAKILSYENLAENPLDTAHRLYDFVHMPKYDYVMNYITKLTKSGRKSRNPFGNVRANSTKTAYWWRDRIDFKDALTVDENCRNVYNELGYYSFNSEEDLRNHFLPTRDVLSTSLFI